MQCTFKPADFQDVNKWVVYSHTLPPDTAPTWIGYCRVADLMTSPDAYKSPSWRGMVLPAPVVALAVLSTHDHDTEALRATLQAVRQHRPAANLIDGRTAMPGSNGRRVRCVDTGVIYESARAAAAAHGLFESQLSVYLNRRKPGTIRGLTFVRM